MTLPGASIFARDTPRFVESASGRAPRYPSSAWLRWGVRLAIGAALAAVALWYDTAAAHDWSATANGALAAQVEGLHLSADVRAVGQLYPPLTSLAALVIPGGALGLGIAGSFVAGILVQLIAQAVARKGYRLPFAAMLAAFIVLTPMFGFLVTTNFEAAVGLTFFGIGMIDAVRFATYANTQAGFRAGLLFAAAAMSDSTMMVAAVVAACTTTLVVQSRSRARVANAAVVAFPTVALFGSLAALGTAFGAGPLSMIRGDLRWQPERWDAFWATFLAPTGWIFIAPVVLMVIASFILGYPGTAALAVLLTASTVLAFMIGLTPTGAAGGTYVLLVLLAVAIVPEPRGPAQRTGIAAIALVLTVLGWLAAFTRVYPTAWMSVLGGVQ